MPNEKYFERGDRVKMKYYEGWAYGEVTIVTPNTCKVIFDGDFDCDYTYYPKDVLEHIKEKSNA